MKILVIDRDENSAQVIRGRLEPLGHAVTYAALKSEGSDEIVKGDFDVVFIDPSPQTNPKPMIVNIRRHIRYYPYMVLMSETLDEHAALGFGLNDLLRKPFDPVEIDKKIENAAALLGIVRHFADTAEDFPSAGGIIAKSAMNQLFLSCIDRADRYSEYSYIIFIGLKNYKKISSDTGGYEADTAVAKLAQHLVRLRRASDIIGQISINEYALLLLRPTDSQEPIEAAGRFAEALSKIPDMLSQPGLDADITVTLVEIPSGISVAEHQLTLRS